MQHCKVTCKSRTDRRIISIMLDHVIPDPIPFFFDGRDEMSKHMRVGKRTVRHYVSYRWSQTTSAEEGVAPSHPGAQRRSRRDSANALAAAHANRALHLLIHAHSLKSSGSSRTLASANRSRKERASPDQHTDGRIGQLVSFEARWWEGR